MVRKALTIAAGLAVVASVASAGVPDPRFSVIDPIGVGDNTGIARPGNVGAGFDVAVKDVNSALVPNALVTLNFSASGVKAYSAASQPAYTLNVVNQTVSRTAVPGTVVFALKTAKYTNSNTVEVSANGVVLGDVKWRSTDILGSGTTGLADFSYFSQRYVGLVSAPECNFDLSVGDVPGLGDFSIFSAEYLSLASGTFAW
jgi:hypothetical protein